MTVDFSALEAKWQTWWKEQGTFEPDPDPKRKGFYIQVAYPYPSGAMHIGHARTYSITDIVAKYNRLKGKNVLFPMGWHVSGTPVIASVEGIKEKDKKTIQRFVEYFRIPERELAKLSTPEGFVEYMVNEAEYGYKAGFHILGLGIDWRRELTTIDPQYKKFITWQYQRLHEQGLVRTGKYPVRFCPHHNEPVGDHDLVEGQGVGILKYTLLKLKRKDGTFLVAATLRPDTVFGQTNLWVNPDVEYVEIEVDGEKWVGSKELAEKLKHQRGKVTVGAAVPGHTLVGETVHAPGVDKEVLILPARFCHPDIGTGIVTSVPSEAPVDYVALLELQKDEAALKEFGLDAGVVNAIKVIPIIKAGASQQLAVDEVKKRGITRQNEEEALLEAKQAVYKESFHKGAMNQNNKQFSGKKVLEAQKQIREWLIKEGNATPYYELEGPVVARGGHPCVVRVLDNQWFVAYADEKWTQESLKTLSGMDIVPSFYRTQYENVFNWLEDKPCTRSKGLGTAFPWDESKIIEPLGDSTVYMAYFTISHLIRALPAEKLSPAFFDYVFLGKGEAKAVAEKTGAGTEQVEEMRKNFDYWYPLAYNVSAIELIPNHMSFSIFQHTALFPEGKRQQGTLNLGMLVRDGQKMSSSKGNVILINDVCKDLGADIVRFFLVNATEPWEEMDWREQEVRRGVSKLSSLTERLSAVKGNAAGFEEEKLEPAQKWLLNSFRTRVNAYLESMQSYELRKAVQPLTFGLLKDLKWHDQRAKSEGNSNAAGGEEALMAYIVHRWTRCMAPFMPHLCEELWQENLGQKGSVFEARLPEKEQLNTGVAQAEALVQQTLEDLRVVQKLASIKAKTAHVFAAAPWKHALAKAAFEAGPGANVKEVMGTVMQESAVRAHGKQTAKLLPGLLGRYEHAPLGPPQELAALKEAMDFLSTATGLAVQVHKEEDAPESAKAKATGAMPGKPAIFFE